MQQSETYTHGYHASVVEQHAMRTAGEAAAFLKPHLNPDMNLLDIGCGPGSITVGLAEWLPDGRVTGVDLDEGVLRSAKKAAAARGLENVKFRVASVYDLPFEDGSFDAVYVHQVLQHLSAPADVLKEALRLLRPGGVAGVREIDWGSTIAWPESDRLKKFLEVYGEVARRNGGDANIGRRLRALFNRAGFDYVRVGAGVWSFGAQDATERWSESWARRVVESSIAEKAVEYGIASQDELQEIAAGWIEWGHHPDAYFSFIHSEALGWRAPGRRD